MNTVVIHHDVETTHPGFWIGVVQEGQQFAKEAIVFARPEAMEHLAGFEVQSAR
jgi:hypothetical protein